MIQFFKTIRKQLISKHKIHKYLLYAIGEIILVVIGILIALKINNWNNLKLKKQDEIEIYKNIKVQITQNLKEIKQTKEINNFYFNQYQYGNKLIAYQDLSKMDTLALITMNLSQYSDFHGNGNVYETLVNSGDIKLLKNPIILSKLQNLEATYSYVNKLEDIHWEIIIQELSSELRGVINYSTMQVVKPDKLFSIELQNIFIESIFLTKGKDSIYNRTINEINLINNLIEDELKKLN